MEKTLAVMGMGCASCAEHIKEVTQKIEGVDRVHVDTVKKQLTISYADEAVLDNVYQAVEAIGYQLAR